MTIVACIAWTTLWVGAPPVAVRVEIMGDAGKNYFLDDARFQAGWKIVGKRDGKDASVSAGDLVGVRFAGKTNSDAAKNRILLATGEVLRGELINLEQEHVKLRSTSLGDLRIPLTAVRAMVLDPEVKDETLREWLASAGEAPSDRIMLKNGDVAAAALTAVDAERIKIQKDDKESTVARDLIAAMLTDPTLVDYKAPQKVYAQLNAADGSRVFILSLETSGEKLKGQAAFGGELLLEPANVLDLSFRNGRVVYLSDLEPAKEVAEPFADDARRAIGDQSVLGSPLRLRGRTYAKGLGVKSRSEIEYSISGFDRFEATVGLDDSSNARGSVRFRVFVDGKTAYDSGEVVVDDEPKNIRLPLQGASKLTLTVDFEKRGDVADFADWCDARLIR